VQCGDCFTPTHLPTLRFAMTDCCKRLPRRFAPRNDVKKGTRNNEKKGTRNNEKKETRNDGKKGTSLRANNPIASLRACNPTTSLRANVASEAIPPKTLNTKGTCNAEIASRQHTCLPFGSQ